MSIILGSVMNFFDPNKTGNKKVKNMEQGGSEWIKIDEQKLFHSIKKEGLEAAVGAGVAAAIAAGTGGMSAAVYGTVTVAVAIVMDYISNKDKEGETAGVYSKNKDKLGM